MMYLYVHILGTLKLNTLLILPGQKYSQSLHKSQMACQLNFAPEIIGFLQFKIAGI